MNLSVIVLYHRNLKTVFFKTEKIVLKKVSKA